MVREPVITVFDKSLEFAGFQRDAVNLAVGFSNLGYPVDLILARRPAHECLWELPASVSIIEFGGRRTIQTLPPLIRYLRQKKPNVLIGTSTECNLAAFFGCRLAMVRTRVVARETAIWSIQGDSRFRGRVVRALARCCYPFSRNVVAISQAVQADLCRSVPLRESQVTVIHNPAVTPGVLRRCEEPLDHPWFREGEPPVVLSAGRLHAHKDFPTLLRAFRLVRARRPVRLVIVGEGPDRSVLEALARELAITEDFELPGFTSNPFTYMAKAAVFALCSPAESFGNVLAEAMACGTPVISTDCPGGPCEILGQGRYGLMVPVGDAAAVARAIEITLDHPPDPQGLRDAAMRFSSESIAREYLKLPAFAGLACTGQSR